MFRRMNHQVLMTNWKEEGNGVKDDLPVSNLDVQMDEGRKQQ